MVVSSSLGNQLVLGGTLVCLNTPTVEVCLEVGVGPSIKCCINDSVLSRFSGICGLGWGVLDGISGNGECAGYARVVSSPSSTCRRQNRGGGSRQLVS